MAATLFHIVACYVLISKLEYGIYGAALAYNITYFLNMGILDLLIYTSP
jgi:Na+-driven multidrug efflux pump